MFAKSTTYPVISEGRALRTVDLSELTEEDFRKAGRAWVHREFSAVQHHFSYVGTMATFIFRLDEGYYLYLKFVGGFVDFCCEAANSPKITINDIRHGNLPSTLNHVLMASEKIKRNSSRGRLQENLRPYAEFVPAYNELINLLLRIKEEDKKAFDEDTED